MESSKERFAAACDSFYRDGHDSGIGTLGEKTIHAVLKLYLEPHSDCHEVKIGRYVADIVGENGIIEIQTASFGKMRKKLECFLDYADVTIVYPIAAVKRIIWQDPETGEMINTRKSPKNARPQEIFRELIFIKELLKDSGEHRLHFKILSLELDEIKLLDGWSYDKKRGSHRYDRIPKALLGELDIDSTDDFDLLIPNGLCEEFTIKEFSKKSKVSYSVAQRGIKVLTFLERIEPCGKRGRENLYKKKDS